MLDEKCGSPSWGWPTTAACHLQLQQQERGRLPVRPEGAWPAQHKHRRSAFGGGECQQRRFVARVMPRCAGEDKLRQYLNYNRYEVHSECKRLLAAGWDVVRKPQGARRHCCRRCRLRPPGGLSVHRGAIGATIKLFRHHGGGARRGLTTVDRSRLEGALLQPLEVHFSEVFRRRRHLLDKCAVLSCLPSGSGSLRRTGSVSSTERNPDHKCLT